MQRAQTNIKEKEKVQSTSGSKQSCDMNAMGHPVIGDLRSPSVAPWVEFPLETNHMPALTRQHTMYDEVTSEVDTFNGERLMLTLLGKVWVEWIWKCANDRH